MFNWFKKNTYLDYASITPIDKRVLAVFNDFSSKPFNPSSLHSYGVYAKNAVLKAKTDISKVLKSHPDEIYFTGSGTEANSIAISKFLEKGDHILVSEIEHSSILEILKDFNAEKIKVKSDGVIDIDDLKKKIKKETKLVSIQWVNNEIGSIQPIKEISKIVHQANGPLFHVDASQAPITQEIDLEKIKIDLLTLDGHKIYGPRGVGVLYIKRGVEIAFRSGTPNVPGIMAFAKSLELMNVERKKNLEHLNGLNEYFIENLKENFKDIKINGDENLNDKRSAHILNVSFPNVDAEFLLFQLDAKGIMVSTKSSCLRDESESYVLKAIGANSSNSIRFSFGKETKVKDLKKVLKTLIDIVK